MPDVLKQNEVHIWFQTTDSANSAVVHEARRTLSSDERSRADEFHVDDDRRDYMLAHALLRRCLSRYTLVEPRAWKFCTHINGKPIVKALPLSFNLSHTPGLVACVVADSMCVGIDVQQASRAIDVEPIAARYFSQEEAALLSRADDHSRVPRFLELWTLREAFLKAAGLGLSGPLNSISFSLEDETMLRFHAPPRFPSSEWYFALFEPVPSARMAVAAKSAAPPIFIAREAAHQARAVPIRTNWYPRT
jgi:4'-phosphopantetheinyl transferase